MMLEASGESFFKFVERKDLKKFMKDEASSVMLEKGEDEEQTPRKYAGSLPEGASLKDLKFSTDFD